MLTKEDVREIKRFYDYAIDERGEHSDTDIFAIYKWDNPEVSVDYLKVAFRILFLKYDLM